MRSVFAFCLALSLVGSAAKTETYVNAGHDFRGAQSYKDAASGLIFYVESDGRHVSAIDTRGKTLWTRDPFSDAHLEYYRTETPQIIYVGTPLPWMLEGQKGHFVEITYSSTQFGILNAESGEFTLLGQD